MIEIEPELIIKLQARFEKMRKVYGKNKVGIQTVSDLVNAYLRKSIARAEENERNPRLAHRGIEWKKFLHRYSDEIYLRDKGTCTYCAKYLTRKEATLDHKMSPLRNGQNIVENMALSCKWCNFDKGILTPDEYYYKQLHNAARGIQPPK